MNRHRILYSIHKFLDQKSEGYRLYIARLLANISLFIHDSSGQKYRKLFAEFGIQRRGTFISEKLADLAFSIHPCCFDSHSISEDIPKWCGVLTSGYHQPGGLPTGDMYERNKNMILSVIHSNDVELNLKKKKKIKNDKSN